MYGDAGTPVWHARRSNTDKCRSSVPSTSSHAITARPPGLRCGPHAVPRFSNGPRVSGGWLSHVWQGHATSTTNNIAAYMYTWFTLADQQRRDDTYNRKCSRNFSAPCFTCQNKNGGHQNPRRHVYKQPQNLLARISRAPATSAASAVCTCITKFLTGLCISRVPVLHFGLSVDSRSS